MITEEQKQKMIDDIYRKASNNNDGQLWIRPNDYGFPNSSEGNSECIKILNELKIFKNIKVSGKGLLEIII
ncbi:MAG: hypothetical protein IJZ35_07605 [Clostridia bacterium]|nr:hypothetical protein [Clostridia bacterium]